MFKVTIDETEYEVRFEHYPPPDIDRKNITDKHNFHFCFGTICSITYKEIVDFDDGEIYTYEITGQSELSIKDQFNRNTGRKIALSRALHNLFDRQTDLNKRLKFWRAYYMARNEKW